MCVDGMDYMVGWFLDGFFLRKNIKFCGKVEGEDLKGFRGGEEYNENIFIFKNCFRKV